MAKNFNLQTIWNGYNSKLQSLKNKKIAPGKSQKSFEISLQRDRDSFQQEFSNDIFTFVKQTCSKHQLQLTNEDLQSITERLVSAINCAASGDWANVFGFSQKLQQENKSADHSSKKVHLLTNTPAQEENDYANLVVVRPKISLGAINFQNRNAGISFRLDTENTSLTVASLKQESVINSQNKTNKIYKLAYYYLAPMKFLKYFDLSKNTDLKIDKEEISNALTSLRFDPFHHNDNQNHKNTPVLNFFLTKVKNGEMTKQEYNLYKYYYTNSAQTPHVHFYTQTITQKEGDSASLAMSGFQLVKYLSSYADAIEGKFIYVNNVDITDDLLNYSLGMPFKQMVDCDATYDNKPFEKIIQSIEISLENDTSPEATQIKQYITQLRDAYHDIEKGDE